MTELWQKRKAKVLTHNSYEEIGEVSGALTRYADDKFDKLNSEEKERVRRIFIQLVQPGEGTEDTRRVATKAELNESNWELVRKLADAWLVVTSRAVIVGATENNSEQETVEVVHEALVKNWRRLREWMEVDREFRSWQEQLRSAMRQWEANGRDKDLLWRGAALAKAEEELQERSEDLGVEKLFILESVRERDRLQKARTVGAIFLGVVSVVAIIAAGLAWNRTKQAELNLAKSLARTSMSLLSQGKDLDAFMEAIRAGTILHKYQAKDPQVLSALVGNIYEGRERNRLLGHDRQITSISISNDSKTIVSGSDDKTIKVWNLQTGAKILTLTGHDAPVNSVSISNDGKTIVSGSDDKTIKVWNLETGAENGKIIVSGSRDKKIKVWNLETGAEIRTLTGHDESVNSVSLSNDGQTIVSGSNDKTIKVWNLETGAEINTLTGHNGLINSVSISNDGKSIVSGSYDKTIKVWNLETGAEILTITGHDDSVLSVSISNDGKAIVSGSFDNTIKVWNIDFDRFFDWLMNHSCDWVRNYLQHNPNVTEDERRLCDL